MKENVRHEQERQQRSLSHLSRCVLWNVYAELNVFCGDDVDFLREQRLSVENLALFGEIDRDDIYTSTFRSCPY